MKKFNFFIPLMAIAGMLFLSCQEASDLVEPASTNDPVLAGGKGAAKQECTTIKEGIYTSTGELVVLGYDKWGYNYQAFMFNGRYCDYLRGTDNGSLEEQGYCEVKLIMKWNAAWLSNMDCDGDGLLDRHYGFDSYIGSGAWCTNHMSGQDNGEKWTYFCKIVAVPADAVNQGGVWYSADGTEIGPVIWGAFAITQEIETGSGPALLYKSPAGPGLGKFKTKIQ